MLTLSLTEDEFRLLAYVRAYADGPQQHLDPVWIQEQLQFSLEQMQTAGRGLMEKGLAMFSEFDPPASLLAACDAAGCPDMYPAGPHPCDIQLTKQGWDLLHPDSKTYDP